MGLNHSGFSFFSIHVNISFLLGSSNSQTEVQYFLSWHNIIQCSYKRILIEKIVITAVFVCRGLHLVSKVVDFDHDLKSR